MSKKDPDMLVDLMAVTTDFEGEVIVQALEAQGIPASVVSAAGRTLSWMVAVTNPIRVQVRRQDLELAREALRNMREESVDLDWDEVDVGEPETSASGPGVREVDRKLAGLALAILVLFGVLMLLMVLKGKVP